MNVNVKVALCIISAIVVSAAVADDVRIENDALRIEFGPAEAGFPVKGIVNRLVGDTKFVNLKTSCGLWRLDFAKKGADGKYVHTTLSNRSPAEEKRAVRSGDTLRLEFNGVHLGKERAAVDVTAEVKVPPGGAASEWRLKVRNRSSVYALYETSYPRFDEIAAAGAADVLYPYKTLGGICRRKFTDNGRDIEVECPGWCPPVTAFHLGEAGLYIAAHDPALNYKKLFIGVNRNVRFDTIVENAGELGRASGDPGYAVTVAAYRGDWWQAAKLYRKWALGQKWAAKGPIAKRADYPKALKDLDLVLCIKESDAAKMKSHLYAAHNAWPDLKIGVNWYRWSIHPFCVNFPEFFPAVEGARYPIELAKKLGIVLSPYTNPRSWDKDLCSWAYAKRDACRSIEGETKDEVYFPQRRLAVMCPTAAPWQEAAMKIVIDAIGTNTVNGCGFTGIYVDQVAAMSPVPCWAEGHTHPHGGGHWWADAYRETFAKIHDYCSSKGAPIFTEGMCDFCLDSLDCYLKASEPQEDEVPFFTAVYSGYALTYANSQSLKDELKDFRAHQMRDFTRGVILGYTDRWRITEKEYRPQQQCLAMLAKIRRAAADFMIYGTLEDELRFVEPVPEMDVKLKSIWRGYTNEFRFPVVMGTVWKTIDGSRAAVIAVNASDESRRVSIRPPAPGLAVVPTDGIASAAYEERDGVGVLDIPPAAATFLCTK